VKLMKKSGFESRFIENERSTSFESLNLKCDQRTTQEEARREEARREEEGGALSAEPWSGPAGSYQLWALGGDELEVCVLLWDVQNYKQIVCERRHTHM